MKRCLIVLLVSLMASVGSATWNWTGSASNSWADANNWDDGTVSPPATIPHTATESMRIGNGTVNADMDDTMGYLMMSRDGTVGNTTVNIANGNTLNVSTGSSELVSVAYSNGVVNNLNVSNGRLNVWRGDQAGELRLNHVYSAGCVGNVNLSGTGVIDVEVLNKGERNGGGTFYGYGGTLVVRDEIDKFAKTSELGGIGGFFLAGSTLEVAAYGSAIGEAYALSIGNIEIGNSQDTDFIASSASTMVFDVGTSANNGGVAGVDYDYIGMEGDFSIARTLVVNLLGSPTVGDYWDVMSVEYDVGTYTGVGGFGTLPANIAASIIDAGSGTVDTLRLTYVPEPATMFLLGLGGLLIRRKK